MRPETGPMRFGEDWTGVFIRGDNAAYFAKMLDMTLTNVVDSSGHQVSVSTLHSLIDLLQSCQQGEATRLVQKMKPFPDCAQLPPEGE